MRHLILTVALIGLSACTPYLNGANERGGIINNASGLGRQEQAYALADAHCKKFGRAARVSNFDQIFNTMTFDCVAP